MSSSKALARLTSSDMVKRSMSASKKFRDYTASGSEFPGDRQSCHDGFERMLVNIGSSIRVRANLVLQPVDIPKLRRSRMRVQEIVDAECGAPAGGERVMRIDVHLSESFAIDLAQRGRSIGAGSCNAGEVMHGGGIDAGT